VNCGSNPRWAIPANVGNPAISPAASQTSPVGKMENRLVMNGSAELMGGRRFSLKSGLQLSSHARGICAAICVKQPDRACGPDGCPHTASLLALDDIIGALLATHAALTLVLIHVPSVVVVFNSSRCIRFAESQSGTLPRRFAALTLIFASLHIS